ncbi:MAG: hypothetical protein CVV61_02480 [Tenericutes bacterium HGW-Tenericutes-6]|nr:MAG: hypothetical protein CVV61_02480 [Tenericutes bacterium HGW-Tenericutes-6]
MKQKISLVLILVLLLCVWLYPEEDEITYLNEEGTPYTIFEVEVICDEFSVKKSYLNETTLATVLELSMPLLPSCPIGILNPNQAISSNQRIHLTLETKETENIQKVNINEASFQTLITVPGITETRAASIIIYREQNGDFLDLDELIHVKYIGISTLEKIKPYLTIS